MIRTALATSAVHSENAVMVGDRMDTDIVAGIEAGLETVLVLTGVTSREDVARFPFQADARPRVPWPRSSPSRFLRWPARPSGRHLRFASAGRMPSSGPWGRSGSKQKMGGTPEERSADPDLTGRAALITGGSRGIGRGIGFARGGAQVVVAIARRPGSVRWRREPAARLTSAGGRGSSGRRRGNQVPR